MRKTYCLARHTWRLTFLLFNLAYSSSTTSTPNTPSQGKKLQLLQLPRISIGRAGFVHQMLPTAIRFWEKEGLGPRSGTKDVVAFALFEESDDRVALVEAWLERAGRVYAVRTIVFDRKGISLT